MPEPRLYDGRESSRIPKPSRYLIEIRRKLRGSPRLLPGKSDPYKAAGVFYEFRGKGAPPADVGRPGDIYWDVVPPFVLYFWGTDGWQPWNAQGDAGSQLLARHPNVEDRYLWIRVGNGVLSGGLSWFSKRALDNLNVDTTLAHSLDQSMQNKLTDILRCSSAPQSPALRLNNQAWNDGEVDRRDLDVPVREASNPQICTVNPSGKSKNEDVTSASRSNTEDTTSSAISAEVEMLNLKNDNTRLRILLEDARTRLEFESSTWKRKYEEEVDATARTHVDWMERHAQAQARIKELGHAYEIAEIGMRRVHAQIKELEQTQAEDAEIASKREMELRERLESGLNN
ncbi:hypothetical protein FB451DRAFT_321722 [Mycena latifolia]|nr:hypothetical protein FB451DRAFT_321722 [Mycena latifolia]